MSCLNVLRPLRSSLHDTYVDQLLSVSESELAADLVHDLLLLGLLSCCKKFVVSLQVRGIVYKEINLTTKDSVDRSVSRRLDRSVSLKSLLRTMEPPP